jgi:hypothetical protein
VKHLRQLPQLFRGPFLRKVAYDRYYAELLERLRIADLTSLLTLSLAEIFEAVYNILLQHYRCEYVFKNALTMHCLSLQSRADRAAFVTDEFRVGKNRVDLAVFGKTSIAYEIKTELDSTTRLRSQTQEYTRVFDLVYVVTTPTWKHRDAMDIPSTVGVLELDRTGCLKVVRESGSHARLIDLSLAFDCLRQSERLAVAQRIANAPIDVPNSRLYRECRKQFRQLLPFEAQSHMLEQVALRRQSCASEALLCEVPDALKHAALSLRASKTEIATLRNELSRVPKQNKNESKSPQPHEHLLPIPARQTKRVNCVASPV